MIHFCKHAACVRKFPRVSYAHMKSTRRRTRPSPAKQIRGRSPRKAPTNLSLRIDLVQRAKTLGLNLSQVVESALEEAIRKEEQARWLAENEKAIDHYNSVVEKYGLFGEEFRQL